MSQRPLSVAIVGATGAVGREMLAVLQQRRFPVGKLRLFASERSAGQTLREGELGGTLQVAAPGCFDGVDVALFSAGSPVSKQWCIPAAEAGAVVVDNSSAFRMDSRVPLVVPEVNPHLAADLRAARAGSGPASTLGLFGSRRGCLLANPNCSTIIMLVAVHPLMAAFGVERLVVSTYQAASGAGAQGMAELLEQTRAVVSGGAAEPKVFTEPYAFNLFSHNSAMDPHHGLNVEETKMIHESHKIWGSTSVRITATCIRVPVLRAHCESINVTLARPATLNQVRAALRAAPGVRIIDDRAANAFPTPLKASGGDDVLVGRVRVDPSQSPDGLNTGPETPVRGFDLFIAGDQLRKGAAQNAVQLAELVTIPA
ncbi:MAG: aspartate-semialdehyde dehydrogenase [Planctomycetaceae bacterium]|nr:aspartate-semialdehyde dehydrogenase [Phycisphaerales bacterium]MCE2652991.1 aspartate-semialdehyde dehydrogenase [Planctomycetaceae bacterium]